MVSGLIAFLIALIVIGVVAWILVLIIDRLPIDASLKQIGRVIVMAIALIAILLRALPLLGVHTGW